MNLSTAIRRLTLASVGIVGLGVLALQQPATAAPTSVRTATNNHCVQNLDTGDFRCYASYAEVRSLERHTAAASAETIYHLATFFDWINYNDGGGTYTVSRNTPCTVATNNVDHQDPTMVDENWNDKVSSVLTFNHCDIQFYKDIGYHNPCSGGYLDRSPHLGDQGCYDLPSSWRLT